MPNPIKYSTGTESLALKKGNFYIGTGDVGKGPTSTTGYYNGITPPSGGYTIYLNKATGGPSIYACANDTELISLTNSIAGTSYATANECFTYFAGQSDKMVLNRDYEGIITDGLIFHVDAGFTPSYPKNGTTWYELSENNNNVTLYNGPYYNNGGIVYDGTDDIAKTNTTLNLSNQSFTLSSFFAFSGTSGTSYILGGGTADRDKGLHFGLRGINGTNGTYTIDFFQNAINTNITVPNDGTFQHFCVTYDYDNNLSKLYLNGNLKLSSGMNSSFTNSSFYLEVGSMNLNGGRVWYSKGTMGNSMVYNRALSSSEILQNFNAQKGRFSL